MGPGLWKEVGALLDVCYQLALHKEAIIVHFDRVSWAEMSRPLLPINGAQSQS
jgi:hypothetical protein